MDLAGDGEAAWASNDAVPVWFDLCQDLTERQVHQMQMREAIDRVEGYAQQYLRDVLRTFVWAFLSTTAGPRGGRAWRLTCHRGAESELGESEPARPDA